mgnify:CR=1 FL=1
MKLLNQSLKHLSIAIFVFVTLWAVVFYFSMLDEIKSSIDEGLENHARLILKNAETDSTVLSKSTFDESLFTIKEIESPSLFVASEKYLDTGLYMQDLDDSAPEWEPVRMMTSTFKLNGKYYELKVANPMLEEDDLMKTLLWKIAGLYVFLIVLLIVLNNIDLKKLWQPFYELLSQLKAYRLGKDNTLPSISSNTTEFNDLQKAVNVLLQNNIQIFEQQKQFIENASHELQTPLAIAANRMELLLEKNSLDPEVAEGLSETFKVVQRMIRLNKSLLLLSKIENKQFTEFSTVSVNQLIQKKLEELQDLGKAKRIDINFVENGQLSLKMEENLADILFSNLLRNAFLHNKKNGEIKIVVSDSGFQICNSGIENRLNETRIFQRFQKFEYTAGSGLGLAICKAIVDVHEISLSYSYSEDLHCFNISL